MQESLRVKRMLTVTKAVFIHALFPVHSYPYPRNTGCEDETHPRCDGSPTAKHPAYTHGHTHLHLGAMTIATPPTGKFVRGGQKPGFLDETTMPQRQCAA